jgi:hypothetical protein
MGILKEQVNNANDFILKGRGMLTVVFIPK